MESKLRNYLETLTGESPQFSEVPVSKLPLFLRNRYRILSSNIFGRRTILAITSSQDLSLSDYRGDVANLQSQLGNSVVFVIDALSSYDRDRLVRWKMPFIVPFSQTFIPMVFMDLREKQPRPQDMGNGRLKKFTPAAQCLLLYHLQKEDLEKLSMNQLAEKLGYSPIMMTKVRAEIETAGLGNSHREGKSVSIRFADKGRCLWEKALPFLRSPVKKTHWVRWQSPSYPAIRAGISALSHLSMLEADSKPTFALRDKTFSKNLEKRIFHDCLSPDEATCAIEAWSYTPLLFGDEDSVDRLSLFLSLRDSPDERVQQQLEHLLRDTQW